MKTHTHCGGINQPAYYGCAGGCCITHEAGALRTCGNECWCEPCWNYGDTKLETGLEYCDLPKFIPAHESDLLAALEAFRAVGGADFDGWATAYDDAIEMARNAIKKARGEA